MGIPNSGKPHNSARRAMLLGAAAIALAFSTSAYSKQNYPTRPIRLIVPYTAGGATDAVARIVASQLANKLGQPVIVENKPGAGGNIGTQFVADAPADGYTLLFATTANAINESLYRNLQFKFAKDFQPVSQLTELPNVLIVSNKLNVNNVQELIDLARSQPGALAYGSAGVGTSTHLAAELFKSMAKVDLIHVPYKGSSPAMTDLRGGQIQVMFDNISSALPQIRANAVKALAVTSAQPSSQLEGVSAISQTLPGYEAVAWHGIVVPAKTPDDIVAKLYDNIESTLKMPEVATQFETIGVRPVASASPSDFGNHISKEISKWTKVVKDSGATLD